MVFVCVVGLGMLIIVVVVILFNSLMVSVIVFSVE